MKAAPAPFVSSVSFVSFVSFVANLHVAFMAEVLALAMLRPLPFSVSSSLLPCLPRPAVSRGLVSLTRPGDGSWVQVLAEPSASAAGPGASR